MEGYFPTVNDCDRAANPNTRPPTPSALATGIRVGPREVRQFLIFWHKRIDPKWWACNPRQVNKNLL